MSPPDSPRHVFALPSECRKDQAVEGGQQPGHNSAAEPVAQTMKEIGWSSSKKWWPSPIFLCMSRDMWAWRTEPWWREVQTWSEGLEKCQQRWQGEVGDCDPSGSLLPWHSCCGPGGAWEEGIPCVPHQSQGLMCVQEEINQCLVCDVQVHPAQHSQHCSSPQGNTHCTKNLQPKHMAAFPL